MNEYIANSDGGDRMESITVLLEEEEKTVRANDPVDASFIEIRNYVMDLIDDEDYEEWEKELKKYIKKENPNL